jgi:polynucleotide 5'-kinase involved in rRNA processing
MPGIGYHAGTFFSTLGEILLRVIARFPDDSLPEAGKVPPVKVLLLGSSDSGKSTILKVGYLLQYV